MTLTEIALTSRLARVSRISCWAAGSPDGGLRKTISTLVSFAALLHPASTIDQNGSGLLLTNATLGRGPVCLVDAFGAPDWQPHSVRDRQQLNAANRFMTFLTLVRRRSQSPIV